jgi:hypothetical protein
LDDIARSPADWPAPGARRWRYHVRQAKERIVRVPIPVQPPTVAALLLVAAIGCAPGAARGSPTGERYFIDFRARSSKYIGHTYIVYGHADASGRVIELHHAGLVPEEDVWNGLFSPIRAAVRKYKDDMRLPPTVIYRRRLTAAEFRRVGRAVQFLRAKQRQWHVIFFNCNDFGIEIAEVLGLRRPPSLMPPRVWVSGLRALNEP